MPLIPKTLLNKPGPHRASVTIEDKRVRMFLPSESVSAHQLRQRGLVELEGKDGKSFFVNSADAEKLKGIDVSQVDVAKLKSGYAVGKKETPLEKQVRKPAASQRAPLFAKSSKHAPRVVVKLTTPPLSKPDPDARKVGSPDGTPMGDAARLHAVTQVNLNKNQTVHLMGRSGESLKFTATNVVNYTSLSRATQNEVKDDLAPGEVLLQIGSRVFILDNPSEDLISSLQSGFIDFRVLRDNR